MKMTITCKPWQKREIIKACINSGECPIDGMCNGLDCPECLEKRIKWKVRVDDNGEECK